MSDPKPLPTLDLRPLTRDPHLCRTTVTLHWAFDTKFSWIIAGRCQLLTDRKPDFVSLEARMDGNVTDESHDVPFAFRLPIVGHTFENVINHYTTITAWINPNEPEDFHVPASTFKPEGYDLREHPDTAPCKSCTGDEAHLIVPYYVPPVDPKFFDLVRGKKVTITIGPAYQEE